jgi:4-amino-4-deoxy-L-arabinose transferase-like glycosyltransferase
MHQITLPQTGTFVSHSGHEGVSSSERRMVVGWLCFGALLRVLSLCFSDNAGGDAGVHAAAAAAWLSHPSAKFVFGTYPPGHFWLIGLFSLVVPNVIWAGRLLSLVCGVASLFIVWRLARLCYGASGALLSLAVFTFYSLHIGYSTTSSAEVPYLFFLLAGTYLFLSGLQASSDQVWRLFLSGLLFSVSESIRFEAWVFCAAIVAATACAWIVSLRRRGPGVVASAVWILAAGLWPVFMMAYCRHFYGDAMYLVDQNHLRVVESLKTVSVAHQFAVMPMAILVSVSPIAVLAGIAGGVFSLSLFPAEAFILAGATLLFAGVEGYEIATGGLLALARYTITLGTMLCIMSGAGVEWAINRWTDRWRIPSATLIRRGFIALAGLNCILLAAVSLYSNPLADELASVSPRLRYPRHIAEIGKYLRSHLKPEDRVVFDDYKVESNIVSDASRLPILPGNRVYLASRKNEISVLDYMASEHPRYLVYSDEGTLRRSLDLERGCQDSQRVAEIVFHCAFEGQVYRVYELSYP